MSLNKFMHPRNRYKYKKPDFEKLAAKYPEFEQYVTTNEKGKLFLDFKNPDAVKILTTCLLQEDYGLKIEIPPDRLVPTLPLRLNYVLWLEDIVKDWDKKQLSGIDIGTGACCVYPILAISGNQWTFLATEADDLNYEFAVKNVQDNNLAERIKVVKVSDNVIVEGVIGSSSETYDFCMCNPPFFADHFEAQGLVSRTANRPDPKTMSTASPQEGIVQGGEIAFVRRMIEESIFLQGKIRVYTTMLGKKASLIPLKEVLRRHKIENFATTEFCQGKTMRWGLAWSFDNTVNFPKSEFSQWKKEGKKSLVHIIPTKMGERRESVNNLACFCKQVFAELKVHVHEGKHTKHFALLTITAAENTWIHSRRKRRQMMREAATATSETHPNPLNAERSVTGDSKLSSAEETGNTAASDTSVCEADTSMRSSENEANISIQSSENDGSGVTSETQGVKRRAERRGDDEEEGKEDKDEEALPSKRTRLDDDGDEKEHDNEMEHIYNCGEEESAHDDVETKAKERPPAHYVLKCHMSVRVQGSDLAVELTWLSGENIQLMHQLMQVLKNRLGTRETN